MKHKIRFGIIGIGGTTITVDKEYFKDKKPVNFTDFEIILIYKKL